MERFSAAPGTAPRAQKEKDDAQSLVREICDRSVTVLKAVTPAEVVDVIPAKAGTQSNRMDWAPVFTGVTTRNDVETALIFPHLSKLAEKIMIEREQLDETVWLKQAFGASGIPILYDIEPGTAQMSAAAEAAAKADQTILFLFDAHIYPTEKQLMDAVQAATRRLMVVLLRDVYDAEYVKEGTLCLTNYGFRVCDIQAVFRKLSAPAAVSAQ